ncbi:MAG TPA: hypothetical protein VM260_04620 [Pirellula sp.]|nr:hypothetical protein [Pirellula sp.]
MTERIVIKVGGATLFQPDGFEKQLHSVLAKYENAQVWLLVGGGDLVETMRTAHRIYPKLDEEEMHWRCIELLDHTWAIAKEIFPSNHAIGSREDLERATQMETVPGVYWVRVSSFYRRSECYLIRDLWLPKCDWSTTSDSLAWLLGKVVEADRLILMKQCECDPTWTIAEAARRGVVDSELARLVEAVPGYGQIIELKRFD